MGIPKLNVDVLTVVCEFLTDVSDILSVSLTCSSVHFVAIRRLLLSRPVYLKSGPSIHRFHSFIFADAPARVPYVRVLDIDLMWPKSDADDKTLLLDILAACKDLEQLTVGFQAEAFPIVADPQFLRTISALTRLRSFTIRSQSIDGLALLPQMCAPVRMLGLHSNNIPAAARYPAFLEQFIPRTVVCTLEELELDQFTLELNDNVQALANVVLPSVLDLAPYPAVRSLTVKSLEGQPLLGLLQHLFPALDGTLHLGGLLPRNEDVYAAMRAANQSSQERDADGSSRAWKKLDRIICYAEMLYVLGLRCPIRLVMLEVGLVREHGRFAGDALRSNPVPRLKLSTTHDLGPEFGELFSPELAGTLTHLTLCLFYSNNYGFDSLPESELKWESVLGSLVSAIRPLHKLTHLRIVVGTSVYVHKLAPWPFAPWGEYAHSFRGSTFNWDGTAAALSNALPSLQNVFLTTGGYLANWEDATMEDVDEGGGRWKPYERWYITHGWRVAKSDSGTGRVLEGGSGLVELHTDVAETIIRNEELVLSALDEAALHLNYGWGSTLSVP